MTYNNAAQSKSTADPVVALGLAAAFVTFMVGYTATRVSLLNSTAEGATEDEVIVTPHQATLWEGFGPSL